MKKIRNRFAAVAASAALLTTAVGLPQFAMNVDWTSLASVVTADAATADDYGNYVTETLPAELTVKAKASTSMANLYMGYYKGWENVKSITFSGTCASTLTSMSFGFGTMNGKNWVELASLSSGSATFSADGGGAKVTPSAGKWTVTVPLTSITIDYNSNFQFRNYYSGTGNLTLTSVTINGTKAATTTADPDQVTGEEFPHDALPKTLTDDTETAVSTKYKNPDPYDIKTNTLYRWTSKEGKNMKTLTFYLEAEAPVDEFTYGFGISSTEANGYWQELLSDGKSFGGSADANGSSVTVRPAGATSFAVQIPLNTEVSYDEGGATWDPAHYEFRNYYSGKVGVTVTKVVVNDSNKDFLDPGAGNSEGLGNDPTVLASETKDNGDGTMTISQTYIRKIDHPLDIDGSGDTAPGVLTQGKSEQDYENETGGTSRKAGEAINSIKIDLKDFGVDTQISVSEGVISRNIVVNSLGLTLKTQEGETAKRFQYGGGINVVKESPADTEYVKATVKAADPTTYSDLVKRANASYWYNDMGTSELKLWDSAVEYYKTLKENADVITPGRGYDITDFDPDTEGIQGSSYFTATWYVPEEVIPYEDINGNTGVSFQYWYGQKESTDSTDIDLGPLSIEAAYLTYTETKVIPYSGTKTYKPATSSLASGENIEVNYAEDLGLAYNQEVWAAVVNVKLEDASQLVYGYGNTMKTDDPDKAYFDTVEEGKRGESNYCVPDARPDHYVVKSDGTVDLIYLVQRAHADYSADKKTIGTYDIDIEYGNFQFGDYYSALNGEAQTAAKVTVNKIDFLYYDALMVRDSVLLVRAGEGNEQTIVPSLEGCTFTSANEEVATVDSTGKVTGLTKGASVVTVTNGTQSIQVTVRVFPETVNVKVGETDTSLTIAEDAEYTSYGEDYATVDQYGKITGVAEGKTDIGITYGSQYIEVPVVIGTSYPETATLWGDADVNGAVEVADIIIANKYLTSSAMLSPQGMVNANCWNTYDETGAPEVNGLDVAIILQRLVNKIAQSELPVIPSQA